MKLTALMLIVACLQVSAKTYSQRVTLNARAIPLEQVFSSIEKQTGYFFYYKLELFDEDQKVTVSLRNATLKEALDKCFVQHPFSYEIIGKTVVIQPKKEANVQEGQLPLPPPITVTGKITDAVGNPLSGASVSVKGLKGGVSADAAGKFSISAESGQTLVISFVGYRDQEVKVESSMKDNVNKPVSVTLQPLLLEQKEIVVVGYGTQKKSDLTGSVSSVSVKDFEDHPVTDITTVLQGRAAGVSITTNSGAPGGFSKIRIRGANSISGGNDPLLVVDGLQLGSAGINDINTDDIENIEILKDASATAIYGSRGANGVILITTKQGKTDKTKLNFTSNTSMAKRSYKYDLLDPVAYAKLANVASPGTYSDDAIAKLMQGGGTDWQDAIFRTGYTQDYQLNVSGKSPRSSYYVSGRYLNQTGIIDNTNYKRYGLRINVDTKVFDRFTVGVSAALSRGKGFNNQDQGNLANAVQQAIIWGPAEPIFNADGTYHLFDDHGAVGKNPVAQVRNNYQNNIQNTAILNTKLSYRISDYLNFDIIAGMDATLGETDVVRTQYSAFGEKGSSRIYNTAINLQISNILTFHKTFGQIHDLTATCVFEQSKVEYDGTTAAGGGNPFSDLLYYNLQANTGQSISSYYGMSTLRSWVGRVNYTLMDKYLLTATYRADGSSKFPNNHWGYFPSLAVGWRISQEKFVEQLGLFSNLKLRASWGITGNQGVSPFATVPQVVSGIYTYGTSEAKNYYQVSPTIGDQNLKWEQTTTTDVGVDAGFFNNRLNFSADYFYKKTEDLLMSVSIPLYQGGGNKLSNVGKVENKGFEFVVSGIPVDQKDFSWNVLFNFTAYKNKVLDLGPGITFLEGSLNSIGNGIIPQPPTRVIVGQPLGTFFGYQFLGIYQDKDAAEAAKFGMKPGDSRYLDIANDKNADGSIKYAFDGVDRVIIGHALPKYSWGLNNTFRYKSFELNVFLLAVQGNDLLNIDYATAATRVGDSRTITSSDVTPWTEERPDTRWPSITSGSNRELIGGSKWLQDGSYVRIRNASFGYKLPANIFKGAPVKLAVSAQNLYTFTKYKGFDPEASTRGNSDVDAGIMMGAYPSPRTFTFSVDITF